jgi:hypothetical protein
MSASGIYRQPPAHKGRSDGVLAVRVHELNRDFSCKPCGSAFKVDVMFPSKSIMLLELGNDLNLTLNALPENSVLL